MRDLVVLEDSTIASMIQDPAYSEVVPCFHNKKDIFRATSSGCGMCAQKRQEKRRSALAQIKSCLAGMSQDKKNQLKKLLDASKVRVVYVNTSGKVVQLTF